MLRVPQGYVQANLPIYQLLGHHVIYSLQLLYIKCNELKWTTVKLFASVFQEEGQLIIKHNSREVSLCPLFEVENRALEGSKYSLPVL